MEMKKVEIDSGILQYVPKGAYYEGQDEQFTKVFDMWKKLFLFDRTLFSLMMLLSGTGFSKGMMTHFLLSNEQENLGKALVPASLASNYETQIIKYNLAKERTPRALKNLLLLCGDVKLNKVNNSRTRKIILEYIFNRSHDDLDNLAINYKNKLKTLIRHALGKQTLFKILNGNLVQFEKLIGRYNKNAGPVVYYIFNKEYPKKSISAYFKKINQCIQLREAASKKDADAFENLMKGLPLRTVMGFRNTYRVPIEIKDVMEDTSVSTKEALQMQSAAKRVGGKIKVDYKKQDIYDLWKILYHKVLTGEKDDVELIFKALNEIKLDKVDIGETVIIIDASKSMYGSDQRPLHPFLTALSISAMIENVKAVIYIGGKLTSVETEVTQTEIGWQGTSIIIPSGGTPLWRGLIDAVITGIKNIVVISDGYENSVKGTFDLVYKHFKNAGYDFNLTHINPVFAADAQKGTVRRIAEEINPLPITDYKFLETEIIFQKMIENKDLVKKLLVNRYQKLIGGGRTE